MLARSLIAVLCCAALVPMTPPAVSAAVQSDLDAFMQRVVARRDDNWKKLQQYVLDEKESFDLTGPGGFPLWGMRREYTWFIRDGIFVRSPITADGVKLSESDRRSAEAQWLRRQKNREAREQRNAEREAKGLPPERENREVKISPAGVETSSADDRQSGAPITSTEDMLKQVREPQFVSSAYFLKFKFETGRYALAGRERVGDTEALKVEYYPDKGLFKDGRAKPDKQVRDEDDKIEEKMNKASMVTLWIDPKTHQILQYTFDDMDWDFFPGRALVRVGDVQATMRMGQAFPNVWLPRSIEMQFEMMLAVGAVDATYRVEYLNYKEAAVSYKIK
ncbi:MAG TPA: hypothetical protein VEC39_09125 [Vicinamibacterales bacterium]|nr:hypothetical protein [Vicinamibacterales bacterium]